MRFGTWNARSLYRSGSLTAAAAREFARYRLALVGVQEVRWDRGGGGGLIAEDCIVFIIYNIFIYIFYIFYRQGNENHLQLETGFFVHHRTV
jgi:hypothetical protein